MKNDVDIQRNVLEELNWESSIDPAQIGVTVSDGIVTLVGHVPIFAEKHTAEEAAKRVHGVRAVVNELEVRPSETHVLDDEEIAAAAVHVLKWSSKVPERQIQVSVDDGWVTLSGHVEHYFEKRAAAEAIHGLKGISGVSNDIIVSPIDNQDDLKLLIEAALKRHATLHRREICVEICGDCATLTGDVHSHGERREAERTAWSARGIRHVENCLTVTPWGTGVAEEWGY